MSKQTDLLNLTDGISVDASGNVGIGTAVPAYALDVASPVIQFGNSTDAFAQYKSSAGNWHVGTNSNNAFTFYSGTYGSGVEHLRIDSSGNVGINNPSPNTKLDIIGSSTNGSGVVDTLRLRNTGTSLNDGPRLQFTSGTSTSGAAIGIEGKALNSADLVLYAGGNTERMRIDSSGNARLNSNTAYLEIAPNATWNKGIRFGGNGNVTDATYANICTTNGNVHIDPTVGSFATYLNWYSGTDGVNVGNGSGGGYGQIRASAFTTISDYRLKENVIPLAGAADRLAQIPVHQFNFIGDPDTTVDGFLAHEAQEVVPESVIGTKDAMRDVEYQVTPAVLDDDGNIVTEAVMETRSVPDYQGIDQSKLVPLLTAALQETLTKIDALEARLTALEAT